MAKRQTLVTILVVVLFLYWVVQDPVGAAATIKHALTWLRQIAVLVANHLIRFVDALN